MKLVYICYVFVFFVLVFFIVQIQFLFNHQHLRYNTTKSTSPTNSEQIQNNSYKDALFDLSKFKYDGICGEVFKFPKNSKRDLWLSAVSFNSPSSWFAVRDDAVRAFTLLNYSIPNADKVVIFLSETAPDDFVSTLNRFDITVVASPIPKVIHSMHPVNARFILEDEFLSKNTNKYDRVFLSDFSDVFVFSDAFATFGTDELIFAVECDSYKNYCRTFSDPNNFKWMADSFGIETARQYAENMTLISNAGVILGGIQKVNEYLKVLVSNFNKNKLSHWGHDQAVHNFIITSGIFNKKKYTLDYCTQRLCFIDSRGSAYDSIEKTLASKTSGCAPVIRHKVFTTHKIPL
ncbi:hypothetical protein EIN_314870 [Entamoeba invadens IP1]|uniref:Nucleotide-diphospho-sugar transferase domain-containing protein n=1 Tax=Entamoeba invadens IP1 TaxID=370355 RepID=A0A0A1U2N6_ENTIV|nr:hypothetical protein EIN_314870 [Entamoeba invadens IP1]ELP86918.1 hypothetical protein EIN_314870 [Entamoeba invadens IP1]|eukprot:XP_004253689.1 hypothetical protein EIN_314870 [Entamoeba invadens IP1]